MKHSVWIVASLLALSLAGCGKKTENPATSEASENVAAATEAAEFPPRP